MLSERINAKLHCLFVLVLSLFSVPLFAQDMMRHVDLTSPDMVEAEMTREELLSLLASTKKGEVPDLSSKRLSGLDLSNGDFKSANLRSARFNNTNLSGADLSGVNLDIAWMMKTNLENANLSRASLFSTQIQGSNLKRANLTEARVVANLSHSDLQGANFTHANLAADMRNQSMGLMRAVMRSANLDNTNFTDAKVARSDLEFASLRSANLSNADFALTALAGADFEGASVKGLILDGADLESTRLLQLKFADEIIGIDTAKNLDEAIRD